MDPRFTLRQIRYFLAAARAGSVNQAAFDVKDYRGSEFDGDGVKAIGGVEFEMTHLVRGEVGGGWMSFDFDDPTRDDIETYTYSTKLFWDPTPLVSVSLFGDRDVSISSEFGSSSTVVSTLNARIDYEFRRNIILSALGSYEWTEYEDIVRDDEKGTAEIQAQYLISAHLSALLSLRHVDFDSSIDGIDYDKNVATAGLKAQW